MFEITKAVTKDDLKHIRPIAISLNTEASSPKQRDYVSKVFNCSVTDDYGVEETWMIAAQCLHKRYHIFTDNVVLEVVDSKGRICPPGEMGEVVVTSLANYGMPFIRYPLGDYAVLEEGVCPCGRGFPLLKSFEGLSGDDPFILPSGRVIAPLRIRVLFAGDVGDFIALKSFKIVQERRDFIKVYLAKDINYTENIEDLFISKIKNVLQEPVEIKVEFVDEIPKTPGRKLHFIESKVKAASP
jgi:phenylacetate-CoA ligase